jgi:hypothetical protein
MGLCPIVAQIPLWTHAIKYFQLKRKIIYTFKSNERINKSMPEEMQIQNPFHNSRIAYSKPVFF